jgi:hypothetical protein
MKKSSETMHVSLGRESDHYDQQVSQATTMAPVGLIKGCFLGPVPGEKRDWSNSFPTRHKFSSRYSMAEIDFKLFVPKVFQTSLVFLVSLIKNVNCFNPRLDSCIKPEQLESDQIIGDARIKTKVLCFPELEWPSDDSETVPYAHSRIGNVFLNDGMWVIGQSLGLILSAAPRRSASPFVSMSRINQNSRSVSEKHAPIWGTAFRN